MIKVFFCQVCEIAGRLKAFTYSTIAIFTVLMSDLNTLWQRHVQVVIGAYVLI
jgi:hypothetical protein